MGGQTPGADFRGYSGLMIGTSVLTIWFSNSIDRKYNCFKKVIVLHQSLFDSSSRRWKTHMTHNKYIPYDFVLVFIYKYFIGVQTASKLH